MNILNNMASIVKLNKAENKTTAALVLLTPASFTFAPEKVQGSAIGGTSSNGLDFKAVVAPRRFKLYCENTMYLFVYSGGGYIKWSRGEYNIAQGDILLIEGIGEFDLNGEITFFYTNILGS